MTLKIPLKQVKLIVFLAGVWWYKHSNQKAVIANGSASRVCLHTCFSNTRFFSVRFLQNVAVVFQVLWLIIHAQQSSKEFQVVVLLKLSHLLAAA